MAARLSLPCPACRQQVMGGVRCPTCGSAYHPECWAMAGGCSFVGCPGSGVHVAPARRLRLAGRPPAAGDAIFGDAGLEGWLAALGAVISPLTRLLARPSRARRLTLTIGLASLLVAGWATGRRITSGAPIATAPGSGVLAPRHLQQGDGTGTAGDAAAQSTPAVFDVRLGIDPPEVRFRTASDRLPSILVTPAGAAPQSPVPRQGDGDWIAPLDTLSPAADLTLEIAPAPGEPVWRFTTRVPPRGSHVVWQEQARCELPRGVVPGSPSFGAAPLVRCLWARGLSGSVWMASIHGRILLDDGATLQALDPATGQLAWWTAAGGVTDHQLAGDVLVIAGPGGLWGMDAATGRRLWAAPLTDVTRLAFDGADLIALGHDSVPHLYRLGIADGAPRDVSTLESMPTYLAAGDRLVALASDRPDGPVNPLALTLDSSGERVLAYPMPPQERPKLTPLIQGGRVILAGTQLVALDPATGTALVRRELPEPPLWLAAGPGDGEITVATSGEEGWLRFFKGPMLEPAGRLREGLLGRTFDMDARRGLAAAAGDDRVALLWLADDRRFPIAFPGKVQQAVLADDGLLVVAVQRPGAGGACDVYALGVMP